MQKIDKELYDFVTYCIQESCGYNDLSSIARELLWPNQLGGESMLFVGLVGACNYFD
jgi:hypothetical protein